jgi:hypothetical protein
VHLSLDQGKHMTVFSLDPVLALRVEDVTSLDIVRVQVELRRAVDSVLAPRKVLVSTEVFTVNFSTVVFTTHSSRGIFGDLFLRNGQDPSKPGREKRRTGCGEGRRTLLRLTGTILSWTNLHLSTSEQITDHVRTLPNKGAMKTTPHLFSRFSRR